MKRITGTHVYTYPRCSRAVALDLHGDRDLRRDPSPWEELVLARGRQVEADHVAGLHGYVEPVYPRRHHEAGAEATLALLRQGVSGVCQGVLLRGDRLGIPDLLRRVPGPSELGAHHYEVLDVKSSRHSRGEQVLQVAFYSRLLAEIQGRPPERGYLVLKDGREEAFQMRDFEPALDQVEAEVREILADPTRARPFLGPACPSCRWSEVCARELEDAEDLSLVQGMTRGLRTLLERNGFRRWPDLRNLAIAPAARRTHVPAAQLRRLKRAAEARARGRPHFESGSRPGDGVLVHFLTDPFAERVLFMGALYPAVSGGTLRTACPRSREEEWAAFCGLVDDLPSGVALLHYGSAVPSWLDEAATHRFGEFVDLARRLRGAAVYPGPVFGLADHVRLGLGEDPHREGHADAAALWAGGPEGEAWLTSKGISDLGDQARLIVEVLGRGGDGPDV